MALQNKLKLTNGLISDNAYIKIQNIRGTKDTISIDVYGYVSKEYEQQNKPHIFYRVYGFKPDISDIGKNFIKQGYEYLKTLDQYKDAVDLLDEGQTT